jgi:nitroreductase
MAVCTTDAITAAGFKYGTDVVKKENVTLNPHDYYQLLKERRSVRNFKNREVPKEEIEKIIEALNFAPYGSRPEDVEITVVTDRKLMEESLPLFEKFYDNIVKWLDNPIARFFIKRDTSAEVFNTLNKFIYPLARAGHYHLDKGDRIMRNAPAMLIFHAEKGVEEHTANAYIYATYAMLAATSLGLGSTLIGLVPPAINQMKEIRKHFGIPEENEAVIALIVGYPKYKYAKTVVRPKNKVKWL